jgi:hypothetical protein
MLADSLHLSGDPFARHVSWSFRCPANVTTVPDGTTPQSTNWRKWAADQGKRLTASDRR